MRLRGQFKTALERQVSEAVTILIEQRKGVHLMNSKSEFNRCSLPRINAGNQREVYEALRREDEEDQKLKADIRCLKKRKKADKKEEVTIEKVDNEKLIKMCDDYLSENENKWKRRKIEVEEKIKLIEKEEIDRGGEAGSRHRSRWAGAGTCSQKA